MKKNALLTYTVLILLAVTAAYSNHFYNGFHFDDLHSIVENTAIRDLKNTPKFFTDGTTSSVLPQNQAYRPVVTTSLALDYKLGHGYNLFYFHLSTFILFLGQGLLMLLLFNKLLGLSSTNKNIGYVVLFAMAWYMLHPAIAETVNYIIARSDVQSTVAVLAGFALYLYSPFCRKTFIYLIPVAIGILAKPTAVMFAPLLFIYILLFEEKLSLFDIFKRSNFKQLLNSILKSLPGFIICALFYLLVSKLTPKTWEAGGNSSMLYLITQPYVILHYFGTFFLPTGLSADSDWGVLTNIKDVRFFMGCLFILVMFGIAFYTSKSMLLRPISFGILWFFIALVPTSSIIPLAEVLNDHRMYFPFVGLVISVSWVIGLAVFKLTAGVKSLSVKQRALIVLPALVLLGACAYGTHKRNIVWHSEENLWFNVTVKSPKNGRGLMNYGIIKVQDGKYAEAEMYLNKAAQLLPTYSFIYVNIGVLKEKMGDNINAESNYLQGIALGNNYPTHYFIYGQFLYHQARFIEAKVMLQQAIDLSSSYLEPRLILMRTHEILQEWDGLKELATSTLKIAPGNADALAALEDSQKKKSKAEVEAEKVALAPTAEKYLNLSLDYYQEGNYPQSIAAAGEAIKLKGNYADAYNNIGCAYNALNQFDKATEALTKALAIKPDYELAKNNLALTKSHRIPAGQIVGTRQSAEEYVNQSLMYFNQKQYALCIAACESALALKPDYDLAYNNLCATYNKLGMWDNAIEMAEQGLKINPNNALLKNNLAEAKQRKVKR
ncbi:MAG TPA: tetratricopeptide repeat protein [Mucilaginibacter sp.]|nr:tetratricopeptide repeat protein [Mucilaginibacter sp.]